MRVNESMCACIINFIPMHNKYENVKVLFFTLISLVNISVCGCECVYVSASAALHIRMSVFNQSIT